MLPHASAILDRISAARRAAGQLLLGLDFDGTLAPLVPNPDDAALPPATAAILRALAQRMDTRLAFLSGRGLSDLKRRVGFEHVYYAGNHGLEIDGPEIQYVQEQAAAVRPAIAELAEQLERALEPVSLTQLEYKVLSLSVHYRRVHDEPTARQVRDIVERTCAPYNGLYLWHGKKVVEVRPDVEWDKGEALRMLRELTTAQTPGAPTLFVGDDRTDEDGFDDVGETGYGIIVADPVPPDTLARAFLRSVDEVAEFLRGLDAD